MLSITGSALVYRNELDRFFATPRPQYEAERKILTEDELRAIAQKAYPGWEVTRVGDRITRRNPTLEVWVEKDGVKRERLFNPYTSEELGDSVTRGEYFVLWLARLHDELLLDRAGRYWNGILSLVSTVLFVTGIVGLPRAYSWAYTAPSRADSTRSHSESAFTTLTPTPCSPPETL